MNELISLGEFARLQGWNPSYVARLKQAGRLVLATDAGNVRWAFER